MCLPVLAAFALALAPAPAAAASAAAPSPAAVVSAPAPVKDEPLFAAIVEQARQLHGEAVALRDGPLDSPAAQLKGFDGFKAQVASLSAIDMQGHVVLRDRIAAGQPGDGDLRCILKGISQDLPKKLAEVEAAPDAPARKQALDEMAYLLDDNVGVILAPPKPPV